MQNTKCIKSRLSKYRWFKNKAPRVDSTDKDTITVAEMHKQVTNSNNVQEEWDKGAVPKFPFYHGINTLGSIFDI